MLQDVIIHYWGGFVNVNIYICGGQGESINIHHNHLSYYFYNAYRYATLPDILSNKPSEY